MIYKQLPHLIASHLGPCLTDYEAEIQELGSRFVSIPGVPSVQDGERGGLKDRFKEVLRKVGSDIPRGYRTSTGAVDGWLGKRHWVGGNQGSWCRGTLEHRKGGWEDRRNELDGLLHVTQER